MPENAPSQVPGTALCCTFLNKTLSLPAAEQRSLFLLRSQVTTSNEHARGHASAGGHAWGPGFVNLASAWAGPAGPAGLILGFSCTSRIPEALALGLALTHEQEMGARYNRTRKDGVACVRGRGTVSPGPLPKSQQH